MVKKLLFLSHLSPALLKNLNGVLCNHIPLGEGLRSLFGVNIGFIVMLL